MNTVAPTGRIASSPLTIPLYDSDIRRSLEYGGLLPPERIGHFSDYERPQPGWLDPLAAELADLADSPLRWTLDLPHRDSALLQSLEAVLERIRREEEMVLENRASSEAQIRRVRRLHDQARLAVERVKNVRFSPISPPRP